MKDTERIIHLEARVAELEVALASAQSALNKREVNLDRENLNELVITQAKLAYANEEMIAILEGMPDGFLAINREWVITYANKAIINSLRDNGINTFLTGANLHELWQLWGSQAKVSKKIKLLSMKTMEKGRPQHCEIYSEMLAHWFEVNFYPTSYGISIFFRNIDERKRIEKSIDEEHKRLYALFDSFPGMIIVQEEGHRIRFANKSFREEFGTYRGKSCYEVMSGEASPCSNCSTKIALEHFTTRREEKNYGNKLYEIFIQPYLDADGTKLIVKILIDITKRRNAELELNRLDRLNLVGEMAAGIAHEVRNPMTTVRGFLQILSNKEDALQYKEFYELMIGELDRANEIITEFLSIAKDKPDDFKAINLTKVVRSLYPLLLADALRQDKEVKIEVELVKDIQGNVNEIRQLILNLVRNGLEAMSPGKVLKIKTLTEEKRVVLKIIDQGNGFDPYILERLGTPFLTTKEKGTGLGLAICQSIVARHKAVMNFESNSEGTVVSITF